MLAPCKESNDKPRQHIKKQRCHFADRGLYRQSYGFSCGGGGSLVAKSCLTLETPWTVACQAPLSMGFSRQEYCSGLPFSSLGFSCSPVQMWKWKWKSLSRVRLFVTMNCIVPGILQARILERVAFPFSRGPSQPRDWTQVSYIAGELFTNWAMREAHRCVQMWELYYKEGWALKNWCFRIVVLEKTLESPMDYKRIKSVNPKVN